MMSDIENVIRLQRDLYDRIGRSPNYLELSPTLRYVEQRLSHLDDNWKKFQINHEKLCIAKVNTGYIEKGIYSLCEHQYLFNRCKILDKIDELKLASTAVLPSEKSSSQSKSENAVETASPSSFAELKSPTSCKIETKPTSSATTKPMTSKVFPIADNFLSPPPTPSTTTSSVYSSSSPPKATVAVNQNYAAISGNYFQITKPNTAPSGFRFGGTRGNYDFTNNVLVSRKCHLCNQDHGLAGCTEFHAKTSRDRFQFVKAKKLCRNCFRSHHTDICRDVPSCVFCRGYHHTTLHDALSAQNNLKASGNEKSAQDKFQRGRTFAYMEDAHGQRAFVTKTVRAALNSRLSERQDELEQSSWVKENNLNSETYWETDAVSSNTLANQPIVETNELTLDEKITSQKSVELNEAPPIDEKKISEISLDSNELGTPKDPVIPTKIDETTVDDTPLVDIVVETQSTDAPGEEINVDIKNIEAISCEVTLPEIVQTPSADNPSEDGSIDKNIATVSCNKTLREIKRVDLFECQPKSMITDNSFEAISSSKTLPEINQQADLLNESKIENKIIDKNDETISSNNTLSEIYQADLIESQIENKIVDKNDEANSSNIPLLENDQAILFAIPSEKRIIETNVEIISPDETLKEIKQADVSESSPEGKNIDSKIESPSPNEFPTNNNNIILDDSAEITIVVPEATPPSEDIAVVFETPPPEKLFMELAMESPSTENTDVAQSESIKEPSIVSIVSEIFLPSTSAPFLQPTVIVRVHWANNNKEVEARALLASDGLSFVSQALVQHLMKPAIESFIEGNVQQPRVLPECINLSIRPHFDEPQFSHEFKALVVPEVTNYRMPSILEQSLEWIHLKDLRLADFNYARPGKIDIVLGANVLNHIVGNETRVCINNHSPYARFTSLGWIVYGSIGDIRTSSDNNTF